MVDMYWQWEGEASSRTKSNIIFHPTQPHPFCKCVTMRRFSATHCIEVADSSGVVTFYAHVSLDFTPKNTAGWSSLTWPQSLKIVVKIVVDMYWQWEGEASSRTKSNIIFHPTQPHPFCKCVTMRRFSATHCIEVADSSGVVTFYAHVSLDFTPKNTAGWSSLTWFCFSSKDHIPWADCPLYCPPA